VTGAFEADLVHADLHDAHSLAPVEAAQVGDESLHEEPATRQEVMGHGAETGELGPLVWQSEQRIEDHEHKAEPLCQVEVGKVPTVAATWSPPGLDSSLANIVSGRRRAVGQSL
jgi:hypothetical protein